MEAVALADLVLIIAAVVGPMLVVVVAMMRYQHLDSTKTRDRIEAVSTENRELSDRNRDLIEAASRENRELIEAVRKESRDLSDRNFEMIDKNRDLIMRNHDAISDVRERVARIEGHMGIAPQHGPKNTAGPEAA